MTHCDFSDLPSEMCSHCMGLDARPERQASGVLDDRRVPIPLPILRRPHPDRRPASAWSTEKWLCERCVS